MSKSKQLIEASRTDEAVPPGVTTGGGAPDPDEFDPSSMGGPDRPPREPRGPGGPGPMRRPMGGRREDPEIVTLRDALFLVLAERAGDRELAEALLAGKKPDPGQIQHILDEAGPMANTLPEPMQKALAEIYRRLQSGGA